MNIGLNNDQSNDVLTREYLRLKTNQTIPHGFYFKDRG